MNELITVIGLLRRYAAAGQPLGTAIETMAETEGVPRLRRRLQRAAAEIGRGSIPGSALARALHDGGSGGGLAARHAALLQIGDTPAAVALACAFIEQDLEQRSRFRAQLWRELVYPLTLAAALAVGMLLFQTRVLPPREAPPAAVAGPAGVAATVLRAVLAISGAGALAGAFGASGAAVWRRRGRGRWDQHGERRGTQRGPWDQRGERRGKQRERSGRGWDRVLAATAVALHNKQSVAVAIDRAATALPLVQRDALRQVAANMARGASAAHALEKGGFPPTVSRFAVNQFGSGALAMRVEQVAWLYRERAVARQRLFLTALQPTLVMLLGVGFLVFVSTTIVPVLNGAYASILEVGQW